MVSRRDLFKGGVAIPLAYVSGRGLGGTLTASSSLIDDDCGVASGDPRSDSVTLWTRIPAVARLDLSHAATLPVRYEVARDVDFSTASIVMRGETTTGEARDFTVKVRAEGLDPYTTYYYRFLVGSDYISVTGRTKTAPAPGENIPKIKFAFVSCQKFTDGYYSTYYNLAKEDVDFCVHLGDHIYEKELGRHGRGDPLAGGDAQTLADYRSKWRHYLTDPHWREVRRLFPWISIWDDHEIFNDYVGSRDRLKHAPRIAAAYQAFDEYIPHSGTLTLSPEGIPSIQMYRSFVFGTLLELFITDQRQYRTPNPCLGTYLSHQCPAARRPEHTMLGATQKTWFKDALASSRSTWKIHASEVVMSPVRLVNYVRGVPAAATEAVAKAFFGGAFVEDKGIYLTLDQWDGYPAEREEIFRHIHDARVDNYVVITGDIHSALQGELCLDPVLNRGPKVGVELVTSAISSETNGRALGRLARIGEWLVRHSNPNLSWSDISNNGYCVLELSQEGLFARHMAVNTVWSPTSGAQMVRSAKVVAGKAGFAGG